MREIKFRGKDLIHNEWIFGGIAVDKHNSVVILPKEDWSKGGCVDEKTVGQYTGIKDINDKEIYEGDIVVYNTILHGNIVCICEFNEFTTSFMLTENALPFGESYYIHRAERGNMEVIGNIYDNPELLKDNK